MLTNTETYVVRNTVEMLLRKHLLQRSPDKISTPDNWPPITSVTLTRIMENSLSNDGVVRVTMAGLLYFFVSGDQVTPTLEEFFNFVQEKIFTRDILLESLKTTSLDGLFLFENATHAGMSEDLFATDAPTDLSSLAPSLAPVASTLAPSLAPVASTLAPSLAPVASTINTAAPTFLRSTPSPTPQNATATISNKDDGMKIGTWVGVILAGAISFLLMTLGCYFCNNRRKKNRNLDNQTTEKQIIGSPNSKTVCSDDDTSSVQVHKTMALPPENNNNSKVFSSPPRRRIFGFGRNEMEELSSDGSSFGSFEDDEFHTLTKTIEPHIVVPKQRDDEQSHRLVIKIQKDMLESSASTKAKKAQEPKSMLGLPPAYRQAENNCVLKPTDVSAATLAVAGLSMEPKKVTPRNKSWWDQSKIEDSDDGDSNFEGWDPDDAASSGAASDTEFSSSIPNPSEQSLLQHSLRNESYKMQRLRTPDFK
jgi:hypothetical protein